MNVTANREALLAAFQLVGPVVPARSPKPMLQNVKFIAGSSKSELLATDLEVGVRCTVNGVQVNAPGEIVLPTAQMLAILKESRDSELQLSLAESTISLRGARSSFTLPTEDPREFPQVEDFDRTAFHTVKSGQLQKMIRRTIFATDAENTRYALNGLLIEIEGSKIGVIATDGRRLAVVRGTALSVGNLGVREFTPVVPAKAMNLLDRHLHGDDDDIAIALEPNKCLIRTPRAVISSRLVEGRFPRYQDVFPSKAVVQLHLNVRDLLQAVRQAAIATSEDSRGVAWLITNGKLVFSAQASDVGQSRIELPINYSGDDITITFDPRYFTDMLRVLPEETIVSAEIIDHRSAAVFRVEDDDYAYVVMPLMRDR